MAAFEGLEAPALGAVDPALGGAPEVLLDVGAPRPPDEVAPFAEVGAEAMLPPEVPPDPVTLGEPPGIDAVDCEPVVVVAAVCVPDGAGADTAPGEGGRSCGVACGTGELSAPAVSTLKPCGFCPEDGGLRGVA